MSERTDSIPDRVDRHARSRPERVALRRRLPGGRDETWTWSALAMRSRDLARAFAGAPSVPLFLARTGDSVAAMLGALRAGVPFAWLDRRLRGPRIAAILASARADRLYVDASAHPIPEALDGVDIRALPAPGETVAPGAATDRDGTGAILFTSGSTGWPRGVRISATDLTARAAAEADWFGLGEEDVLLAVLPFSFDVGLNQVLSALRAGAEIVVTDSWLPADLLAATAEHGVTGISGVPSIWRGMMRAGLAFDRAGLHASLRYVTVSGGDLDAADLAELPALVNGAGIFKTYGQTETFRTSSLRPEEFAARPASVGRAFPGVAFRVVRPDGTICRPGEVGEVVHTGLGVMLGYLGAEGPPPREIRTGDHGTVDEAGFLTLAGRADDMLKIADTRVYPAEVARQIRSLAEIRDAEVVRGPIERGEPTLVAFVTIAGDGRSDPADLRRRLLAELPRHLVPGRIEIVDAMPLLANGKLDRARLQALAR